MKRSTHQVIIMLDRRTDELQNLPQFIFRRRAHLGLATMATAKPPPSASAAVHASDATTSGDPTTAHHGTLTDRLYNAELARRSVARAALHLGIDRIEGQALDCLGDALLEYLDRFGASLAGLVEASNRTSAHCNVLDALHAAERTTARCALVDSSSSSSASSSSSSSNANGNASGNGGGGETAATAAAEVSGGAAAAVPARSSASTPVASNTTSTSTSSASSARTTSAATATTTIPVPTIRQQPDPRSWESLAEFLFGPDWLSIQLPGDELEPKLVREYEEQLKAEGKYVPPQRSASITAGSGSGSSGAGGGGNAGAAASVAAAAAGKSTTGSTDTVSSILAEAAQLAAKSASRSATPTPAASAGAAASGPDAAGNGSGNGNGSQTTADAASAGADGGDKAGDKAEKQTVAPAPRKGKQLPATALMPANATAPGTPGATNANAVNVHTPGSIGKTAGPGGKALTPSAGSGGGGGTAAAGTAAASDGKAADATPGKKEGETPSGAVAASQGVNTSAGLGGKAVPRDDKGSAAAAGRTDGQDDEDKVVPTASVGWDAPFPDEIPPYPLLASHSHRVDGRDTSKGPANPHRLPFGIPLGLHLAHLVGAEEACRIDYGPNGPRKHLHKVGKSMATLKAERDEERKRRRAERAAGNTPADKHTAEMLDAAHKLAQEHAAARAKAKAEDQLKEVPEAYFSAATLGSSYWGSVAAASASASAAGDAPKSSSDDKMDIDTADTKVAAAAAAEGADKEAAGRKRARFEDEGEGGSVAKRARTESGAVPATPQTAAPTSAAGQGSKSPTSTAAATAASQRRRPGYVPQFLPPFPPARTYLGGADGSGNAEQAVAELLRSSGAAAASGTAFAAGAAATASAARRAGGGALTLESDEVGRSHGVRKSLVGLGSTRSAVSSAPWGAPVTTPAAGGVTAPAVLDNVSVPAGRRPGPPSSGPSAGGSSSGKKSPTAAGTAAGIQPLSRASNARVSKVLEGSLDAN